MDIQEILSHFERNEGHFPRIAVQEAISRRDEIVPALIGILRDVARNPQPFASDEDRMVHLYAMFLLAQFRETQAYPLIVQIFSSPGDLSFDLAGDDIETADLGRILASVSAGDIGGMTSIVENEQANEWVRSAAMDGLLTLVACGERSREEVIAYLGRLFHKLDRTPSMVWNGLVSCCVDLCPEEMVEDLRQAYGDNLVDPGFIAWEHIEAALAVGQEAAMERLKDRFQLITDVTKEMGSWACFAENARPAVSRKTPTPPPVGLKRREPIHSSQHKVGRNDPCPCGSGKKFKKCCGS